MRSASTGASVQEQLPLGDLPAADARDRPARGRVEPERPRYRLSNDALASRGWPAGTELVVEEGRRAVRGDVALVREGARLRIGVLDVQFGRGVLRTDHGSVILGAGARHVGVVTQVVVGVPLDGMPDLSATR
ncbi:hypothetical protein ACFQ0K_16605 [Nocardioides caeni]|uniref:Uncharacterized protein n=1 Tax=Nocardioides caeni TaxID=574700 RepID=A0A4S8NIT8_9ACTN|nr:hypothetical protein [Nocardioides caeni]THV16061.1 hypothetical protein E9934_06920 [Nocardioides caeni]